MWSRYFIFLRGYDDEVIKILETITKHPHRKRYPIYTGDAGSSPEYAYAVATKCLMHDHMDGYEVASILKAFMDIRLKDRKSIYQYTKIISKPYNLFNPHNCLTGYEISAVIQAVSKLDVYGREDIKDMVFWGDSGPARVEKIMKHIKKRASEADYHGVSWFYN